jgi:hypothetical protein
MTRNRHLNEFLLTGADAHWPGTYPCLRGASLRELIGDIETKIWLYRKIKNDTGGACILWTS